MSGLQAEVITDFGAAATIEDEWRHLAGVAGNAFVTPEWYSAGRRALFSTDRGLWWLVVPGDRLRE